MASFIVNKLIYEGEKYFYESPDLKSGLNIIEGDNETGKSTFVDLIYYALSGNVSQFKETTNNNHTEIVNDVNNYVQIYIEIDDEKYVLKRLIGENDIYVSGEDFNERFPVFRNQKYADEIFSDWFLKKIGIRPVKVFQGYRNWTINVLELFRLIYHDQEPNPKYIFKLPDVQNPITDTLEVRKIIFQLLIGKSYLDYYDSLTKYKKLQNEKNSAKSSLDEYEIIAKNLSRGEEDKNVVYLKDQRKGLFKRLERLKSTRKSFQRNRTQNKSSFSDVEKHRDKLESLQLELNNSQDAKHNIVDELIKLEQLEKNLILESTQIKKIINAHDELNLFSPDTCPYCLRKVDRDPGKCVCGKDIEEEEYEKFFYNSEEYTSILKQKQKSVETVREAQSAVKNKYRESEETITNLRSLIKKAEASIIELTREVGEGVSLEKLDEIDDEILDVKTSINRLNERIEIEEERNKHQNKFNAISNKYESQRNIVKELEAKAEKDFEDKLQSFDKVYNEFMINSLNDCKDAKLDRDTYKPIINNGEYRAASSAVHVRLMYYFTLLYLSVVKESVNFPRFLLVDTPETAGIDLENLKKGISQIKKIKSDAKFEWQIILTTGIDKYPSRYDGNVKVRLRRTDRLLQKK